jgi:hypothetical protein
MPISNGQITSRDIRQNAIKPIHVFPAAIDTAELADLAVTVDKNNTMVAFDAETGSVSNVTIDTTETQQVSVDVTVPAWATLALWVVDSSIQVTTGGSALTLHYRIVVDDSGVADGTGFTQTLPASATQSIHPQESVKATVTPSSTVTVGLWAWVDSSSNASNQLALRPGVIFAR